MNILPRKDVLIKQLKISGIPIAMALTYAIYGYCATEEGKRSFTIIINYFAAGFFFLMWLVSQYLRTAKQIDDSTNYEALQAGITDVKESIEKLHSQQNQKAEKPITSNSMLESAKQAINAGYVLAGLMQAGVALEQAIIKKAVSTGLYQDQRVQVAKVINSLRGVMHEGVVAELFAVWKLRNQLAHLTPEAASELEQRPELINYFEWAISELEK